MADDLDGTAGDGAPEPPGSPETPEPTPGATAQPAKEPESFINPADLPVELKPHWSRMHRAYTKALEKTRRAGEKAALVDQFWSDQDFARQTIQQWAQQNGVTLNFGDGRPAASPAASAGASNVPQELVSAIEAELPQELRWMARALAASSWKAQGHLIEPLMKKTQAQEASTRTAEYETLAEELSETAPGWQTHEDDMSELLDFLRGPSMRSKRWGSKLQVLHGIVTGGAVATREAVRRIGDAARNRTSTGMAGRSTTTNITERVRGAKTDQEAWKIAAEHAVEELRRSGVAVP